MDEQKRLHGRIKFFDPKKGFGFITGDDGVETYVHERTLAISHIDADDPDLRPGQRCSYGLHPSRKFPGRYAATDFELEYE